MTKRRTVTNPDEYWDRAGQLGYAQAMYSSSDVEGHVRQRLWCVAINIADKLGVPRDGLVLDLGCGDGAFANEVLASHYQAIDGLDKAETAIQRASAAAPGPHLKFRAVNLVNLDYGSLPNYDAAFLIGFLHHVKDATPSIVSSLSHLTKRVIVLEPNGNNIIRKLFEFTPEYRRAGEDSFRTKEIMTIFERVGYRTAVWKRMNIFPNFTPSSIYRLLAPVERRIENSPLLNALCTVNMFGFER